MPSLNTRSLGAFLPPCFLLLAAIGLPTTPRPGARPASSWRPAGDRAASASVRPVHLDLEIQVHYGEGTIEGRGAWTVENTGREPVSRVPVQLGRLMRASEVWSRGQPLVHAQDVVVYDDWPTRQVDQLWITLPEPLEPGERVEISVAYAGHLIPYTETGMLYVRDHVDRDFTILRAESFGFPQLGTASSSRIRIERGDFTYRMRITVPKDLVVATGIPETARAETDSLATWTFDARVPVPFLNVAIAPYETLVEGDLRIFHFPEDVEGAGLVMHAMQDALRLYEQWFGPLESGARLHVIEIPEGWGSQADLNAGIIQTADAFRDPSALTQLYHELAHLWHPDDMDPAPPRWNEGLATFLQYRVAAVRDGAGSLDRTFSDLAARHLARLDRGSGSGPVPMIEYGEAGVTGRSYGTGALMFYILYRALGEEAFDRVLTAWFRRYRSTGSTTRQFVDLVQGESWIDLGSLFSDWLFTPGWEERLRAGESLEELIAGYRGARAGDR